MSGEQIEDDDLPPERSRWAWAFGIGLAVAFLTITVVASVVIVNGMGGTATTTLASSEPTPTPSERETLEAAETTAPDVEPTGRVARTPEEVLAKTKYVKRYRDGMPDISAKHPDIGKNGLANHGATMCAMISDRRTSIFDMVRVFMLDFHAHPGPVTETKALLAAEIAVQEICPDLSDRYAEKLEL